MTTEMTLTDRAVAELSEFNTLIESVQPYADLTVAEDGIGKVEEAHKAVRRLNSAIEKKRKELKAGALEYGRTVDSIAKQLTSAVDKIEGRLGAEREAFEAVKDAERKATEAEKLAAIQKRIDRCQEIGVAFVLTELQSMADDDFEWWFAGKKKDAARIAAEAEQARQFEEKQRREREELAAKLKAEQEELNRQRDELRKQQEELRQAQMREQQEKERREAELLEKRRAEERKRREDAAKPELEKLTVVIDSLKAHAQQVLVKVGSPAWHGAFAAELDRFAMVMEQHVREAV